MRWTERRDGYIVGNALFSQPYPTGDTATNTSAPALRLPVPLSAGGTVAVSYSISITGAERSDIKVGKPHASGKLPVQSGRVQDALEPDPSLSRPMECLITTGTVTNGLVLTSAAGIPEFAS